MHAAPSDSIVDLCSQGLACTWKSSRDWVKGDGAVNIDFFSEHFGQAQVTVSDTTRCEHTYHSGRVLH